MFIVVLTAVALAEYVIIAYCIMTLVAKPPVRTAEEDQTMNNPVTGHVNDNEELISYIEDQNYRIALLSFNVNKILSNIDAIIGEKK